MAQFATFQNGKTIEFVSVRIKKDTDFEGNDNPCCTCYLRVGSDAITIHFTDKEEALSFAEKHNIEIDNDYEEV